MAVGGSPGLAVVVWPLAIVALLAYLAAARRERRSRRGWSGWRTASFVAGTGLLAVAVSPPLAGWSHHDLRGHMAQHLLLGMLAPLGLVLAAPATLLLRSLSLPAARRVTAVLRSRPARCVTHPVAALVLDSGGLYLLYLTPLYAATLSSPGLHALVHLHFLAAGCLFAWAVAGPDPAPHRPGLRVRVGILFVAMAAHGTLAKAMYAGGWPRGTHHDLAQIRDAARLMYYGGDLAEILLATALFGAWYRASGRRRERGRVAPEKPAAAPAACRRTRAARS